ncbi:MAG TPA: hypothetical protein VJT50_09275 [Pyrinomonadaceae bacterium]|nr:hypothetical protein [Pyrinomonadaceae bacterium]
MVNPARVLAKQFIRSSPTTLLGIGVAVSLIDFAAFYAAAAKDGVFYIDRGIGLFTHYGLFSSLLGNAVSWYAAKKYFDGVCSIRISKAVVNSAVIEKPLEDLKDMVELRGKYQRIMYSFFLLGTYFWASNVGIHIFGDPLAKWGQVFDNADHRWSFLVGRLHNIYSWMIVMPFVAHVVIWSSLQLRQTMKIASDKSVLSYDLLNPDQRGGFGFIDNSLFAFNIVVALVYVEIALHNETFGRLNLEHIVDYIILTGLLIGINRMFFANMYATIRKLRVRSLNRLKDEVFRNNQLSFEILKYCYQPRIRTLSVANFLVQATAIAIPGIIKYWPTIAKVLRA